MDMKKYLEIPNNPNKKYWNIDNILTIISAFGLALCLWSMTLGFIFTSIGIITLKLQLTITAIGLILFGTTTLLLFYIGLFRPIYIPKDNEWIKV
jgi:hypothetical protein